MTTCAFSELLPEIQQELISQEQDFILSYELSEAVTEALRERVATYGLPVSQIGWQVSNPQCADGVMVYGLVNVKEFLTAHHLKRRYQALLRYLDDVLVEIVNVTHDDWHGPRSMRVEIEYSSAISVKGYAQLRNLKEFLEKHLPRWAQEWRNLAVDLVEQALDEATIRATLNERHYYPDGRVA
jgi:hypothetical protein